MNTSNQNHPSALSITDPPSPVTDDQPNDQPENSSTISLANSCTKLRTKTPYAYRGASTLWTEPYRDSYHAYDAWPNYGDYRGSYWCMVRMPEEIEHKYTQVFCTQHNPISCHMWWPHSWETPEMGYMPNSRHAPVQPVSAAPDAL